MVCNKCNMEVKDGQRFCTNCGSSVEVAENVVKVEEDIKAEDSYTTNTEINNEQLVVENINNDPQDTNKNKKSKRVLIIVGIVLIVILLISGGYYINKKNTEKKLAEVTTEILALEVDFENEEITFEEYESSFDELVAQLPNDSTMTEINESEERVVELEEIRDTINQGVAKYESNDFIGALEIYYTLEEKYLTSDVVKKHIDEAFVGIDAVIIDYITADKFDEAIEYMTKAEKYIDETKISEYNSQIENEKAKLLKNNKINLLLDEINKTKNSRTLFNVIPYINDEDGVYGMIIVTSDYLKYITSSDGEALNVQFESYFSNENADMFHYAVEYPVKGAITMKYAYIKSSRGVEIDAVQYYEFSKTAKKGDFCSYFWESGKDMVATINGQLVEIEFLGDRIAKEEGLYMNIYSYGVDGSTVEKDTVTQAIKTFESMIQ